MKFTEYLKAMRIVELHEGYIDYERLAASAEEVVLCNLCASATCTHLVAGFNKEIFDELARVSAFSQAQLERLRLYLKQVLDLMRFCNPSLSLSQHEAALSLQVASLMRELSRPAIGDDSPANQGSSATALQQQKGELFLLLSTSSKQLLSEAYQRAFQIKQMCEINLEGFRKVIKKRQKTLKKESQKREAKARARASTLLSISTPASEPGVDASVSFYSDPGRASGDLLLGKYWISNLITMRGKATTDAQKPLLQNASHEDSNLSGHPACQVQHSWLMGSLEAATIDPAAGDDHRASSCETESITVDQVKKQPFYASHFRGSEEIARLIEKTFAAGFTAGDIDKAQKELRLFTRKAPSNKTFLQIGLFGGISCGLAVTCLCLVSYPAVEKCPDCTEVLVGMAPVYRLTFIPILWCLLWSGVCRIWRQYNVNYPYILEIDGKTELGPMRGMRLAFGLLAGWFLSFTLFFYVNRTGVNPILNVGGCYYPFALMILYLLMLFCPPGAFHFKTRIWIWESVRRTLMAPFLEVRLRENLVADVFTSMVKELTDFEYAALLFLTGDFTHHRLHKLPKVVSSWGPSLITIGPYWCRMWQCFRRYWDSCEGRTKQASNGQLSWKWRIWVLSTGDPLHLVNAVKYMLTILATTLSALGGFVHTTGPHVEWTIYRQAWLALLVLSTLYAYAWDIIQDMGLIRIVRSKSTGRLTWYVRTESIFYSRRLFAWIAISNLLGRTAWAMTIVPNPLHRQYDLGQAAATQITNTVIAVLEVARRAQWTVLRVEHEYSSNPSHYRSIVEVPIDIPSQEDGDGDDENPSEHTAVMIVWGSATAAMLSCITLYYSGFRIPGHID